MELPGGFRLPRKPPIGPGAIPGMFEETLLPPGEAIGPLARDDDPGRRPEKLPTSDAPVPGTLTTPLPLRLRAISRPSRFRYHSFTYHGPSASRFSAPLSVRRNL